MTARRVRIAALAALVTAVGVGFAATVAGVSGLPRAATGCGPVVDAAVSDDSFVPVELRRGATPRVPLRSTGMVVGETGGADGPGAVDLARLPSPPPGLTEQLTMIDPDGAGGRVFYADHAIDLDDSFGAAIVGGAVVFGQQYTSGQTGEHVIREVGERAVPIAIGDHVGALLHADPLVEGLPDEIRSWHLYWSDGIRDYWIIGVIDPAVLIGAARSLACTAA